MISYHMIPAHQEAYRKILLHHQCSAYRLIFTVPLFFLTGLQIALEQNADINIIHTVLSQEGVRK